MKNHLSDEELIKAISENNDKEAELELINRYKRNAFFIAKRFFREHRQSGITIEEYYAVTLSDIIPAALKFTLDSGYKFSAFFETYSHTALSDYDTENSYLRDAKAFAGELSLDYTDENYTRSLGEELGDIDPLIKESVNISDVTKICKKVLKRFPERDKYIFALYVNDCSMKEIADELNVPLSTVYRVIDVITSNIKVELKK